jgi:hypothetical protein
MISNRRLLALLIIGIVGFLTLALVFGEMLGVYDIVWWWDDSLHAVSGILLVFIGLYVLQLLERKTVLTLKPITIALFVFCFAIACDVAWEIYEFIVDVTFGVAMQQWNMPPNAIVMGKSYQGMGLRDTMSDLILSFGGALVTSLGIYIHKRRGAIAKAIR